MNLTYRNLLKSALAAPAVLAIAAATPAHALDLTKGTMASVPLKNGQAPVIDGDLKDWDLSGAEPIWIAPETASLYNGEVSLMHDADAIYIGARLALPNRPLNNPNGPADAFWSGDVVEFRLVSDPALPAPLEPRDETALASNRVAHLTLWKNTLTQTDYLNIAFGVKFDKGQMPNPPGSKISIKTGINSYTVEARVPWSALNVPGGKNPFGPNQKMTAVWGLQWGGTNRTAALYRANPGDFAFMQSGTWGQVEFATKGNIAPRHITMAQALAADAPKPVGVPIEIDVKKPSKVSVNIFGPNGEVVRELMGGQSQPEGKLRVHWDGRDQWGAAVTPGNYRWGAYFSDGLQAEYVGAVGMSGEPAFETADGKGAWGADHGNCIDVAADASGMYFLWEGAEGGRAIVKTDYAGKVLWRKTPFVGGGFGPHYAVTSNGKNVFLSFGGAKPNNDQQPGENNKPWLVRLDAATGQLLPYSDAEKMALISSSYPTGKAAPGPHGDQPETVGLAATATEVFASVYSKNIVQILDPETGAPKRTLSVSGPRGLALAANGDLFAVSYAADKAPQVVVFRKASGQAQPVITTNLSSPWDVAVDAKGRLHVSDGGNSHQLKVFSPQGKFVRALGKAGGRPWAGKYQPENFLNPVGVAADAQGGVLLAEASPPKAMSRWSAEDGRNMARWFGRGAYSTMAWPDPNDPLTVYYTLSSPEGPARDIIPAPGKNGVPDAYWVMKNAGYKDVGTLVEAIAAPEVIVASNGKKYYVNDSGEGGIALVQGDQLLPVGSVLSRRVDNAISLHVWSDTNGDHHQQPDEVTKVETMDGKPLPMFANATGSRHMEANGDMYLITQHNSILRLPSAGFAPNGAPRWDTSKLSVAVPRVLDRAGDTIYTGWRDGILGVRLDSKGNFYTALNTRLDYATPEITARYLEGLGHTASKNAVKFAKFAPDGKPLWVVGRKATAAAKPGEMYHFWVLAGMIGDDYVAGQSEWGQFYIYTQDGFYVDSLMNNPGLAPPADAYNFGGETFGGRVQYFPQTGQVWAYQAGQVYRVNGIEKGKVAGESRVYGTVEIDRTYDAAASTFVKTTSLQFVPLAATDDAAWNAAPIATLRRNETELATAQLGYDAQFIHAKIHVKDDSPLQNSADSVNLAFKGGDAVGLTLGAAGKRDKPAAGDVRILAANIGGKPKLIAYKPFTSGAKTPERYFTPATGERLFQFVGEVPNGKVTLTPDADGKGYTALLSIPRAFLETEIKPGVALSGDIEVLLSGQGARGLQATSRNYLFTPSTGQTGMTDDIPTESWLYPQGWGAVEIK